MPVDHPAPVSPPAERSPTEPAQPERLTDVLKRIRADSEGKSLTVGELHTALQGRGAAMLLLLLALPFCFIPIPGLSTPFGLAVFLIGLRLTFGQHVWLPRRLRDKTIPIARLAKLLRAGARVARILEKVARARLQFIVRWPGATNLIGLAITSGGLLLLLPLPIPFSNTIPAWAVVLLTAGLMEKDGLLVLLGYVMTLASWAYLVFVWLFGAHTLRKVFDFW